jgi:menaquinone-dependent protoporphyrinogen IX oxidase
MKGLIIYMSKAGSTREYAEMLSEETGFPIHDLNNDRKPDLKGKDIVVIGSWILAGKMVAHSWITKNWEDLKNKNVILFSTSASEPDFKLKKEFLEKSLPREMRKDVNYFPLHGRFEKKNLNALYRGMFSLVSKMFKNDELVKDLESGVDGVDRKNLDELIQHIGSII